VEHRFSGALGIRREAALQFAEKLYRWTVEKLYRWTVEKLYRWAVEKLYRWAVSGRAGLQASVQVVY